MSDSVIEGKTNTPSALRERRYLDVTYSVDKAPRSSYPKLLADRLFREIYGSKGRMLEMGCGRGDHIRAFAEIGFDVVGVDISERAPELAAEFDIRVCDMESEPLPFPAQSFDHVFSKSVVEHMRDPMRLLSSAHNLLRPGGVAVIMTPSWEHTYWGPFYIDHTHVTPFTATSLADAMAIAGFEEVKVSYFYQLPFVWRLPFLLPLVRAISILPLPYRPFRPAPWPEWVNKLLRFSKEVMLLGVGFKRQG